MAVMEHAGPSRLEVQRQALAPSRAPRRPGALPEVRHRKGIGFCR